MIKDHLIPSKAFSRSILRIILAVFSLILEKWLVNSWKIIALSEFLLVVRKLDWLGLMILGRNGLILLTIILVMTCTSITKSNRLEIPDICSIGAFKKAIKVG